MTQSRSPFDFLAALVLTIAGASLGLAGCTNQVKTASDLPCAAEVHANAVEALKSYEALSAAQAANRDALLCMAYAQISLKRYEAAAASATRAIVLHPMDALALRLRSYARYRMKEYGTAILDAKLSASLAPCGEAYEIIAKAQLREGLLSDSVESFQTWVSFDGSAEASCWLGSALWQSGDQTGALKTWERAELDFPKDPEPFVWKCGFLYTAGDHGGALGAAMRAVELAPNSAQTLGALARVQQWSGDTRAASDTVERLAKSNPAAAQKLVEALRTTKPAGKT
ncbi:MAG: tetratricopeptide repeat protein [Phycisphaerales bacterium]|nr:tetratricopeptide repeat protein [Phycisphaerales bacterium]